MTAFRSYIVLLLSFIVSVSLARSEETPSLQNPRLRIEAGMHTATMRRVDVSADGKLLVTGSDDKTVRLWSLPEGKLIRTFRVPVGYSNEGKIFSVALSPDGRLLAAGGWDGYVYLFDTILGSLAGRLGPFPGATILDLAFSSDGQKLAAGLSRNGIRIWRAPFTGQPTSDAAYDDAVYGVAFDRSSSRRFATTSWDGNIRLYDGDLAGPPKKKKTLGGSRPLDIDFTPDGSTLAVGYSDSAKVDLYSVPDLVRIDEVDTAFAQNGNLSKVTFSYDGKWLYAGGSYADANNVRAMVRWSNAGRGKPEILGGGLDSVFDLAPLADGSIVFGSADPAFGVFRGDGTRLVYHGSVMADMRDKVGDDFGISDAATGVWFGLNWGRGDPRHFDVDRLNFEEKKERVAGYLSPITNTLPILNWRNTEQPTLGSRKLELEMYETARSLAIAPDAKSFIIGSEFTVYKFDATGKKVWEHKTEGVAWGVNLSADGSIVVVALGDGTIRWLEGESGKELLAFFIHVPDKRWIAWTPTGYYAASSGGEDLIGWHINGKTQDSPVDFFPASLFREKFYRPDIVQLVLKTKDEAKAVAEANEIAKRKEEEAKLPAVVEILADPRGIETDKLDVALKYRLRSPGGRPITRLEVKLDGRPIDAKGMEKFDPEVALDTENLITVGIPPQDSVISLIAFIGDQPSEAATVGIKWTGKKPEEKPKPKLTALLIGVTGYTIPNMAALEYADDDAKDLESLLKAQKGLVFSDVKTRVIVNGEATKKNILAGLTWLDANTEAGDYALLLLSGHGLTDNRQKFYFLPIDADTEPGMLRATSVTEAEIKDVLSAIRGGVVFFVDACRSGAGVEGLTRADAAGLVNGLSRSDAGIVMFASSTADQDSLESVDWKNGAFTEGLIAGLKGEANYERDGAVDTGELQLFLPRYVLKLTQNRQQPIYRKPDLNKDFALTATGQ
jgi:WD40 repeat protein